MQVARVDRIIRPQPLRHLLFMLGGGVNRVATCVNTAGDAS